MEYKFYVKMDGETRGPYSAKEVRDLQLMDDILVIEEGMSEWLPAGCYDFDDMVKKELGALVNEDETISRSRYDDPTLPVTLVNSQQPVQSQCTSTFTNEVPDEIKGWNWGAFFFGWIWGVFNGVYWPLALIVTSFIPYVGVLISLGGRIALGINGSEWAWKAIQWSNVAEFKRIQRKWVVAVIWILGLLFLTFLINILASIVSGNIH